MKPTSGDGIFSRNPGRSIARALGVAGLLFCLLSLVSAQTVPPVLTIAKTGTNLFGITITNGVPTNSYNLYRVPALTYLTNHAWVFVTNGSAGQTNFTYDSWLRPASLAYTGTLAEQNLTTTLQYESRGYLTNYTEQFASTNTGPATSVVRRFDLYGQLISESVNGGPVVYGDSQTWDVAGRRTQFNVGNSANYGFAWRSDYTLAAFLAPNGSGLYGYDTAGLLTNRTASIRSTTITSRDGEGHPLAITTTVNGATKLTESLAWLGDGLLASDTLNRADFTDSRSYAYANLSRRLAREQLSLNATNTWTNTFGYDGGQPGGPGVLTSAGQTNAQWSGISDVLSRLITATNTTVTYSAYGHVNGQGTVNLWLDSHPLSVTGVSTNVVQWGATMELSPGPHQLIASAVQPGGQFTAWATNSFTNCIAYQTTSDTLDYSGNTTQRVWLNANGTTNRVQTFAWDARGRLHAVTLRDAGNSGYNWTAVYDGLNRRLSTTSILVTNGVALAAFPNTINEYYDPQAEFLQLGVAYGTKIIWKLYGPDADGVYGGLNGVGGFDGFTTSLGIFNPVICDFHGNVLAVVTNNVVAWNPARPTAYGAVPGYRPVALGNGANLSQASAWDGRWPDITGLYNIGQRVYDPVSQHWLSGDPLWNERDPNWYTLCGGDPVNYTDANGRLASVFSQTSAANQALQSLGGYLNNYNNTSGAGGYLTGLLGAGVNELQAINSPSTYVNGLSSFGNNISTVYNDSGALAAGSYALTSWNVGAIYSGAANLNLATGEPVGDWYQRGGEISGGVAGTAGLAAGGLSIYNWATSSATAGTTAAADSGGILGPAGPGQFVLSSGQGSIETAGVVRNGEFVNRVYDSGYTPGAGVSGPLGRSFAPGSGVPTTAAEAISQRGLNIFYPNNAQGAAIYQATENIPATFRTSIGGTTPEVLIDPANFGSLKPVIQYPVAP